MTIEFFIICSFVLLHSSCFTGYFGCRLGALGNCPFWRDANFGVYCLKNMIFFICFSVKSLKIVVTECHIISQNAPNSISSDFAKFGVDLNMYKGTSCRTKRPQFLATMYAIADQQ